MTRTLVLGKPSPHLVALARTIVALQVEQIAAMKPGALASDVDRIVREGAVTAGIRADYTNITGYTIGYYPDYAPRASDFSRIFLPTSNWRLEVGMVFHFYMSASGIG